MAAMEAPFWGSEHAQETTRCRPAHNSRPSNVVMIIGRAGAGKSTLANKILDHPDYDVFEEGHGTAGVTTKTSRATHHDLVVIDTPGVPSLGSDAKTTVEHFDSIVARLRREQTLSALIFLVHQDKKADSATTLEQIRGYRVLLEQINHLPCSKLIVCRQPELTRRTKRAEEERRNSGGRLVEKVLEESGLNMPLVLLADGYTEQSNQQIAEIVNFVRRSERVEVGVPSLRTSKELREHLVQLADPETRLAALKQEVKELETSLWFRTLWMAAQVVPLAYVSVTSVGAGFLWTGPYVKREQEEAGRIRLDIRRKQAELEQGVVDEEELELARERLCDLDVLVENEYL